jgi:itaconyl-CoA hydratase
MGEGMQVDWARAPLAQVFQGNYFEDLIVGALYRHRLGRTITETDNIWFTLLTGNTNPLHFDREYARQAALEDYLVNSTFTLSLITGLSVADLSENAVANLGWTNIALPVPVRVGDTLRSESIVVDKRESNSRPYAGIVNCTTRGLNQNREEVISFDRTILVYRRGHGPRAETAST